MRGAALEDKGGGCVCVCGVCSDLRSRTRRAMKTNITTTIQTKSDSNNPIQRGPAIQLQPCAQAQDGRLHMYFAYLGACAAAAWLRRRRGRAGFEEC